MTNEYDDLLESFLNDSNTVYFDSKCGDDEVKKTNYQNSVKNKGKLSFGHIITIIVPIITLITFMLTYYFVDFTLVYNENTTCYELYEHGTTIKNAHSIMYYIVEFNTEDDSETLDYIYDAFYSDYNNVSSLFTFDVSEELCEKVFCEAMSYMYLDTSEPYNAPKIRRFVQVNYEIIFLPNITFTKWYEIRGNNTKLIFPFISRNIKKTLKNYNETSDNHSLFQFYYNYISKKNNSNQEDVLIKNDIDELLSWINKTRAQPLNSNEESKLYEFYENNIYNY